MKTITLGLRNFPSRLGAFRCWAILFLIQIPERKTEVIPSNSQVIYQLSIKFGNSPTKLLLQVQVMLFILTHYVMQVILDTVKHLPYFSN